MPARPTVLILAALALVAGAAPAGAAESSLFTRTGYPVGPAPTDVTLADVNGDGVADLVSAVGTNEVSWGVSVALGREGGGFAPHTSTLTGQALDSVQAIDLTGDGNEDVIAARSVSEGDVAISVLQGLGEGTFADPVSTDLPIAAEVVFGDFTSAGPSAAVARTEGVEIYRPYTLNGFTKHATLSVTPARRLLAVDLDGDGLDELVTADDERITLYRDLAQTATLAVPAITSLVAADATGDGLDDVLALSYDGKIRVLDAGLGVVRTINGLPNPTTAGAGDVDGNGTPDIVVANQASTLSVHRQTGSPTTVQVANAAMAVFVADATGDGAPDLLAADGTGAMVEVIDGDGAGGFAPQRGISYTAVGAWDLDGADFDNDGKIDVVAGEWDAWAGGITAGRGAHVMLGKGDGTFARSARLDLGGHAPSGTSAGDVNGDGNDDVITSTYYGTALQFLGNGDGTFLPGVPLGSCMFSDGVTTADLNEDGFTDAAFICRGLIFRDHVEVMMGSPAGLVHGPQLGISHSGQTYEMETGDVNGDGNLDIAWASFDVYQDDPASCGTDPVCTFTRTGRGVSYYLGLGAGLFDPVARSFDVGDTAITDVALEDLDGDGRDDVIAPLAFLDVVQIRHGRADGSLGAPVDVTSYEYPLTAYAADLTGDGKSDLVMGHGPYTLSVMRNTGDGFAPPESYAARAPVGEMVLADANGDGVRDVIAGNYIGLETFLNGR